MSPPPRRRETDRLVAPLAPFAKPCEPLPWLCAASLSTISIGWCTTLLLYNWLYKIAMVMLLASTTCETYLRVNMYRALSIRRLVRTAVRTAVVPVRGTHFAVNAPGFLHERTQPK